MVLGDGVMVTPQLTGRTPARITTKQQLGPDAQVDDKPWSSYRPTRP